MVFLRLKFYVHIKIKITYCFISDKPISEFDFCSDAGLLTSYVFALANCFADV